MSVAKITEISASSPTSFEDAIERGIGHAGGPAQPIAPEVPFRRHRLAPSSSSSTGTARICRRAHARSSPMPSVTAVRKPANYSGNASRQVIKVVKVSVICGKLTNLSSRQIPINVLEKVKGKQTTWNVGITG